MKAWALKYTVGQLVMVQVAFAVGAGWCSAIVTGFTQSGCPKVQTTSGAINLTISRRGDIRPMNAKPAEGAA